MTQNRIVEELKASRKYGSVCNEVLIRIASWAAGVTTSERQAVKAAKRKLHQIHGCYFDTACRRTLTRHIEHLCSDQPEHEIKSVCHDILALHQSTRERLPILDSAFRTVLGDVSGVGSVLDIACGLNPFAIPWMKLPADTRYTAVDIDTDLIESINRFLGAVRRPQTALCRDVMVPAKYSTDIALILKALPCFEQQEKGAALRLLSSIEAQRIIISFPARSVSGREKGMRIHYGAFVDKLADQLGVSYRRFDFATETFYEWRAG